MQCRYLARVSDAGDEALDAFNDALARLGRKHDERAADDVLHGIELAGELNEQDAATAAATRRFLEVVPQDREEQVVLLESHVVERHRPFRRRCGRCFGKM